MSKSASEIFDLRNFYFYQSGNSFTGSLDGFNYKIEPQKDVFKAMTWSGKLCSELDVMDNENKFPFTEDGFKDMIKWLEDIYKGNI
jgi:hypothetical protein